MNILVTGAYGFIGRQVVAGLLQAGHSVVCGVRKPEPTVFASLDTVVCDFAHDTQPEDWLPRLSDIDVVVNCAGILREGKGQTFDAIHRAAPGALFDACTQAEVKRVVQVSALGSPEDGGFIRSRHAADGYLVSFVVGFITPQAEIEPLAQGLGLSLPVAMPLIVGVSVLDLLLGICLLLGLWVPVVGVLMLVSVLAYTLVFGIALPNLWLDPLGGLLKNLAVIPALLVMLAIERIR